MIQSLLRAMELLELLKEANHKYSIAELSESKRAGKIGGRRAQ